MSSAMDFHPMQSLREMLFGRKDLGAGRIDQAVSDVREQSEKLTSTIEELARERDPLARLVHNMNESRMHRFIHRNNGGDRHGS